MLRDCTASIHRVSARQEVIPSVEDHAMARTIAILEDNGPRIAEMWAWLAETLPDCEVVFFDNANAIINWLSEHLRRVSLISLDHDLLLRTPDGRWVDGGTGREVVDSLVRSSPACPVLVHSSNEVAAQGMLDVLRKNAWKCTQVRPYEDVAWIRQEWAEAVVRLLHDVK
jgi:hypothetical protein